MQIYKKLLIKPNVPIKKISARNSNTYFFVKGNLNY